MSDLEPEAGRAEAQRYVDLPPAQAFVLLLAISVVALCGIVYELIIGTISSYLLGNSVYQFSLTIGFFMFAMGIGSYLSKFLHGNLVRNFVVVEILLSVVGGICSLALFFVFPFAPGLYQAVMFGFILTIGTLVGLEIPLLTRILAQASGTRRSIANVMSLDYVGALIGSVAFPLMLLPGLGLMRSSFAIGLINISVAFISLLFLKDYIPNPKRMMAYVIAAFVALAGLTLASDRLTSMAQHQLYFDKVIWKKQTPYQNLVVTRNWQKDDLRLFIDGHIQFSQTDEYRYHEALVHPVMGLPGKAENVLVMGGGDGLAVRELIKYPSIKRIDLVDLDPDMTKMGKTFPPLLELNGDSLSDPRVHIYNEDAFLFIRREGLTYDRVILDFPDPHNEAIAKLYSLEFYKMVSLRLSEGGAIATQSSSPFFARRTFWTIEETLGRIFPGTLSFNVAVPAFGLWGFNIATMNPRVAVGDIKVPTRFLTDTTLKAATVFSPDIAKPKGLAVNSIFEPILYEVYIGDLKAKSSTLQELL
ncbi:MAG: polyamine aminopropyltransferase [Alphaproteobacteria bacterium]|nr:polyamine aminopropyltransferase [Alphaproteobacteria bacterium]